jgi:hypothetical protein
MKTLSKSLFVALVILVTVGGNAFAQNFSMQRKVDIQVMFYNEMFYSSDLSILGSNPQKSMLSNTSIGANVRYVLSDTDSLTNKGLGSFYGITYGNTFLTTPSNEDISLLSIGVLTGYFLKWSNNISLDISAEVSWARYKNEFTYQVADYDYTKNGVKGAITTTVYFSPFNNIRIGFGLHGNVYLFNDNKKVDNLDLQLPDKSRINSLSPFITASVLL